MPLLPVAVYGLEVPAGDLLTPAVPDFPSTFRITMAAIDPSAPVEVNDSSSSTAIPRATLKIVRMVMDEDEDEEDYLRELLAGGSDSEDDSDEEDSEEVNGGPSDPSKSKKARKEAAVKQLLESLQENSEDEEMDDIPDSASIAKKGKSKATDEDNEDEDSEDDDGEELEEFVLCTLDPKKHYQQPLDITIAENERVFFKVTGSHTVYLTGNYVIPDDDGHNHHHEVYDSDEEDEEEEYDLSPDEDELELEMDDEESDILDALEDPRVTEVGSDDEDDVPDLIKAAVSKGTKKRSADELEEGASLDDIMAKSLNTPTASDPKLSKKQLKKLKKNNGEATPTKEEAKNGDAKGEKSDKKVQFAKNLEQGPSGSPLEKPKAASAGKPALGVKTINGITIDDKKIGTGPAIKKGDRAEMRYIGKLESGAVFDSNKKGKAFSFKVGVGEVIKGWDIGVVGMQVGGERRLTVPSQHAYGSSSMPGIPKNSTLIFDIKLLSKK